MQLNVTSCELHIYPNYDDRIVMTLDIPDSVYPFEKRATCEIRAPNLEGEAYVKENFPDLEYTIVEHDLDTEDF